MQLTGKQKAAMLLMSLDAATATELLKDIDPKMVEELAFESAYLDSAGLSDKKTSLELAQQFCNSLKTKKEEFHVKNFLCEMLKNTVGEERTEQIQTQIEDLIQKRDPFKTIRTAETRVLASILEKEHPQTIAVVLSELDTKKSSEVLELLAEGIRLGAIFRMTNSDKVTPEAKIRIAGMVCNHLETAAASETEVFVDPKLKLRKVAVMLRNLNKELRDGLLSGINEKDEETGKMVAELMVTWEDIPLVSDRSLQEALRGIDSQKLALSLLESDQVIADKINSNISERAAAAIKEETALMSDPIKADIDAAREEVVSVLREMNQKGELTFLEE